MASLNKMQLIGNLGADPEIRYMPDGTCTARVNVATTDSWKDKTTGEKKEKTEWHRVVFFRSLAEVVGEYLKKGSQIYVEGKMRTQKWTDKEGIERYTTELVAHHMQMLGKKTSGETAGASQGEDPPLNADDQTSFWGKQDGDRKIDNIDDDIPF